MVEKAFVVFTDGGCEPNPGRAGAGFILKDADGTQVAAMGFYLGDGRTCNEAEYSGLLHAVEAAVERGATRLDIFSDSVLLVRQVEGRWKLKAANLQEYYQQIMECLGRIASWRIQWVPRQMNEGADTLAGLAIKFRKDLDYSDREILGSNSYADGIRRAVSDYLNNKPRRGARHRKGYQRKERSLYDR